MLATSIPSLLSRTVSQKVFLHRSWDLLGFLSVTFFSRSMYRVVGRFEEEEDDLCREVERFKGKKDNLCHKVKRFVEEEEGEEMVCSCI